MAITAILNVKMIKLYSPFLNILFFRSCLKAYQVKTYCPKLHHKICARMT